uniref:Leucine-rich repeat flightless-interacting protein 1 isoform X7 n=1 Tax=Camelus bactrianus TaxID=9837 RepID=A0A9W3FVG6_CAMBA|nr:leucine-rich repeat flightless-interacting protein 1 isoform X7 [Camelus bactrianus]
MTNPAATQNKEIDCLSPEAQRLAEARLAAKRAARAEAREIRMKELERQQKEIYQVQKKYYGLDTKWGDIEQWMEDSERYSRRSRRNTSASDEDERMSVGSRGSLRSQPDLEYGGPYAWTNGYDGELYGSQSLNRRSGGNSSYSGDGRFSTLSSSREETLASVFPESSLGGARRGNACGSHTPSEPSGHLKSSSRSSSRASSARASPVVEERPEKDFTEKGSRSLPGLSAATLASLGGTSSRRGSGDTSISLDTEASIRELKELNELKDQIQDVEGKYMQGLKEMKDSLAEVEEKYKKAMVSNAQLDNEKTNFMYQVDTLKDTLLELEEQLAESRRQYEEKNKEFEREKHAHSVLQFQFAEVKEALKQREEMLEEIRQLQQKQESYSREISDLQETIEWKDKKIGKHGIILNSEIATNGETSDALNNVGYQGSPKMTKEELSALKATGDGTLGRANEVEVESGMVENEGRGAVLQSTGQEQRKEDPVKDCVDTEVLHPGEGAEDQTASEDSAPSPGTLVNVKNEEQGESQIENTSLLENPEQVESSEVIDTPGDRAGASLEQSGCLCALDDGIPGPGIGQGGGDALEINNQSKESAEKQEKENQEDCQTNVEEISTEPRQESAPLQVSEVEGQSNADTHEPSGSPTEAVLEAGLTGLGEQVGTVASGPPGCSDDTVSYCEKCVVDATKELDPSIGHDVEKEPARQEAAEPQEVPVPSTEVGGENSEEDGRESRDEEPMEMEVQTIPRSPAASSSPQVAPGLETAAADSEAPAGRDPDGEKDEQQGEALDSSQKKAKNKKKKNKKKKSPVPAETKDTKKEFALQTPDLSEGKEVEQGKPTDQKPAVEVQNEVTENPEQSIETGSNEDVDCPGDPKIESERKFSRDDSDVNAEAGRAVPDGDTVDSEDDAVPSSGTSASDKGLGHGVVGDDAEEDSAAPSRPPGPENEVPGHALLEDQSPSKDANDASQTEDTEGHMTSESLSQTGRKDLDHISLENDDSAPAGKLGDFSSESREEMRGRNGKGRSKEECSVS